MNHDHSPHDSETKGFWGSHFFGALPFLLLLACPLMHLFMHHGHGGRGGSLPAPALGRQSVHRRLRTAIHCL